MNVLLTLPTPRSSEIKLRAHRRVLSNEDAKEWEDLLAYVSMERESVQRCMGFALDNAEYSEDVGGSNFWTLQTAERNQAC